MKMYDKKEYFIFSVAFSLIVPGLICLAYLYKMYCRDINYMYIAEVDSKPEIILEAGSPNIFTVEYLGNNLSKNFVLAINNIHIPNHLNKLSLTWKLYRVFGENDNLMASGNFEDGELQVLKSDLSIGLYSNQKYRLDIYLDDKLLDSDLEGMYFDVIVL